MAVIERAVARGYDPQTIRDLLDVQKEWEANEARKAYNHAMSQFRANCPVVYKDRTVRFCDSNNQWHEYNHVSLPNLASVISTAMAPYGLSYFWRTDRLEGGLVRVSCVITHELGHSESTALEAGLDQSGKKNNIQAMGSTVRYLQRYTLEAMTGIVAADEQADDDGVSAGASDVGDGGADDPAGPFISEEQAANIQSLIDEVGVDKSQFLRYFRIRQISELRAQAYEEAVGALERRRRANGKAARKGGGA